MDSQLIKKGIAEFIGTFILTFVGCGVAAVNTATNSAIGVFGIAAAFGLSIVGCAYCIGKVSGCHINPAVSLALWLDRRMETKDFITYVIFQFLGGIAAAACLKIIFDQCGVAFTSLGTNGYGEFSTVGISMVGAIVVEVILTFIFVMAVLGVTSQASDGPVAGLVIGGTLTLVHLLGIQLTGTSVNPARSFGPALIAGGPAFSQVWVFVFAPLLGACLAACIWHYFASSNESKPEKK